MKKLFTNLKVALTLLLLCGVCSAWAEDVTYTITPDETTTENSSTTYVTTAYSFTYNEIGWSFNQWNPSTLQIKTNQSSAGSEFNFKNTSAFPGRIKSVVIKFETLTIIDASKLCFVGGESVISSLSGGTAGAWNSTAKTLTWTPASTENYTYFAFYQNGKAASGTNNLASTNAIEITYENDTPSYEITALSNNGAYGTVSLSGSKITASPKEGYRYASPAYTVSEGTATVKQDGNVFTVTPSSDCSVQINFEAIPTYTVKWSVNGSTDVIKASEFYEGSAIVFPTDVDDISGQNFVGWIEASSYSNATTAPEFVTSATATADMTYYAVFAEVEVGEEISIAGGNMISGAPSTWTISGTGTYASHGIKFDGEGDNIISPELSSNTKSLIVKLKAGHNGGSGSMLTISALDAEKNELTKDTYTPTDAYTNQTTIKVCELSATATIAYVKVTMTSKTTNLGMEYCEIFNPNISCSNYCTTVKVKELTSIEVTGTPSEFWKGETFNNDGMTVTAYYDDDTSKDVTASADFTGYDMSTAGNQTVTVTYGEKTTTYNITVKAIENTLETAYTVAEAKAIIDANPADLSTTPVYVKGVVSSIATEWSSQYGNISFNVSADGQTTGDQFQFFRNFKGSEKTKWASADECPAVGDEVIGYGTLTKYGDTYEFAEGNYFVSQSRDVEVSSVGWATVCLPFRATITSDNATAYYVIGTNGTALTKVEANVIPAGEGVLLKSNDGGAAIVTFTASAEAADAATDNMMKGSLTETTFDGTGYKYYILTLGTDDNLGFYWDPETRDGGKTATCPAGKAVLAVPTTGGNAKMFFYLDDDATGINNVEMSKMTNGIRYNLNGQAVGNDFKGVVIVNGKKFVK